MSGHRRLLVFVALLSTVRFAFGQASQLDFERVAPKLPTQADQRVNLPTQDQSTVADDTPVFDSIKGIVLLDHSDQLRVGGWPGVTGVKSKGSGLIASPKLAARLAPFLGKPATFGKLQEICAEIVRFYRDSSRPVVDAQLPEQDVTNGVLQILVVEGRAAKIVAEGQRWFPENLFVRGIRSPIGGSIDSNRLLDDINWLNRNPFRHSDLLFRKGEQGGETDIVVKTTDRFPLRPYIAYDNTGTDLTGNDRLQAGVNWGNAFGLDQVLSYQFSTATDPKLFQAHAGIWTIPLPWRNVLEFYGSYARTRPDSVDVDFDAKSLQLGTGYTIPLPNFHGIKHDLSFGAEFKQSNNNILFGGANIFDSSTEIFQFRTSYLAREIDASGSTTAQAAVYYSPGGFTSENTDSAFEEQRAFAKADYFYGRVTLQRTQKLPWKFSLVATAVGQLANGNLLPSEQFSIGGATTVRGYEEGIAIGDRGWLGSIELYTPPVSVLSRIRKGAPDDELKLLVFFDAGGVSNVERLPGEDAYTGIAGVGAGLRYRINTRLSVRFDYAWSLENIPGFNIDSSRAHVSVSLSY